MGRQTLPPRYHTLCVPNNIKLMKCDPVQQSDGRWKCSVCGYECSTRFFKVCSEVAVSELRPPSIPKRAWNLAVSLAAFVADGCKTVDKEEYERRLHICDECEFRSSTRCLKCGCNLSLKAKGRAFKCPIGKWNVSTDTNKPKET